MNYLDQTGLEYLWGKIKTYVDTVVEDGVGEIVVNWDDIKGKPSTFTPSTHTHTVSQITDFPTNIVTNVNISGSGNAVTNASFSDNTLTITKGTIQSGGITEVTFSNLSDDLKDSIADANNVGMAYGSGTNTIMYNETDQPSADWIGIYTESLGSNHNTTYIPVKTINRQSIFGTGNINTSYTSTSLSYSAGQFELRLESTNSGSTLRDTCPFEYNDLAGIPTFKTVNGQSIIGSGDIAIQGGSGGDGNYYPTAMLFTLSGNELNAMLRMSGTSDITAAVAHFATVNGTPIIGSSDNNIVINWDTLQGKPSWAESGEITWDDITDPPAMVSDVHVSGSGNAVVDASYQGGTLTLTKGTISAGTSGITQSEADGRYVNVSGDTMTGALTISSGGITLGHGEISLSDQGGVVINNLIGNEDNPEMASFRITNGNVDAYGFYTNCTAYFNYAPIFAQGMRVGVPVNRNGLTVNINDSLQQVEFDTGAQGGFEFNSSVYALAFYESSDVSLKENIVPITKDATDAVDCLTFKQFNFKDDKDKTTKYGVIAQEVEAVGLGNLVKDNGETKSVDYISLLILKIEALEKRIAKLEAERR